MSGWQRPAACSRAWSVSKRRSPSSCPNSSRPSPLSSSPCSPRAPSRPRCPENVGLAHLHAPAVSVREQAGIIGERLRRGPSTFRALVADADSTLVVVARFLALLELARDNSVAFEQAEALGS